MSFLCIHLLGHQVAFHLRQSLQVLLFYGLDLPHQQVANLALQQQAEGSLALRLAHALLKLLLQLLAPLNLLVEERLHVCFALLGFVTCLRETLLEHFDFGELHLHERPRGFEALAQFVDLLAHELTLALVVADDFALLLLPELLTLL